MGEGFFFFFLVLSSCHILTWFCFCLEAVMEVTIKVSCSMLDIITFIDYSLIQQAGQNNQAQCLQGQQRSRPELWLPMQRGCYIRLERRVCMRWHLCVWMCLSRTGFVITRERLTLCVCVWVLCLCFLVCSAVHIKKLPWDCDVLNIILSLNQ